MLPKSTGKRSFSCTQYVPWHQNTKRVIWVPSPVHERSPSVRCIQTACSIIHTSNRDCKLKFLASLHHCKLWGNYQHTQNSFISRSLWQPTYMSQSEHGMWKVSLESIASICNECDNMTYRIYSPTTFTHFVNGDMLLPSSREMYVRRRLPSNSEGRQAGRGLVYCNSSWS